MHSSENTNKESSSYLLASTLRSQNKTTEEPNSRHVRRRTGDTYHPFIQQTHHLRRHSARKSIAEEISEARRNIDVAKTYSKLDEDDEELSQQTKNMVLEADETEDLGTLKEDDIISEEPVDLNLEPSANYAIAFDIDGVLLKGTTPIPGADEAMRILNGENDHNLRVPYIFLTNGGGKSEAIRCRDLSDKLQISVSISQFIQSHTPMRAYSKIYNTVLVVGGEGDACREIALEYGFKDVITPRDIIAWNSDVVPFATLTEEEKKHLKPRDFSKIPIDAIFVFADSRDWASDQQIIIELLCSKNGVMGTVSATGDEGPPIYFSNPDVLWATGYSLPRYGMGALRKCIETLYETAVPGKKLKCTQFGKPYARTYEYAASVLNEWSREHSGEDVSTTVDHIYMIGDNPESDIRGANDHGWISCLVRTGVFRDAENSDKYPAKYVFNDVLEAVKNIMNIESQRGKSSKSN